MLEHTVAIINTCATSELLVSLNNPVVKMQQTPMAVTKKKKKNHVHI